MATATPVTVGNAPELSTDPAVLDQIERICNDYVFGIGPMDETVIEVRDRNTDSPYLFCGGSAPFTPVVRKQRFDGVDDELDVDPDFWSATRHRFDDTIEFLQQLSTHLDSQFVVRTVCNTKLRYPPEAYQYRVTPGGTVHYEALERGGVETIEYPPEQPEDTFATPKKEV